MEKDIVVKKAAAVEIFNHWLLAVSFFGLVFTGFAILYRIESMIILFGDYFAVRGFHEFLGVVFMVSLAFTAFSYLEDSVHFDIDDLRWLKKLGCYFSKCTDIPPQGRLTAGQKVFYMFVLISGIVMSVTGLFVWMDLEGVRSWLNVLYSVHKIAFYAMIVVVPMHMLVVILVIPQTLRVIFIGTISLEWAKDHHAKWLVRRSGDRE